MSEGPFVRDDLEQARAILRRSRCLDAAHLYCYFCRLLLSAVLGQNEKGSSSQILELHQVRGRLLLAVCTCAAPRLSWGKSSEC